MKQKFISTLHLTGTIIIAITLVIVGAIAADRYKLPFIHEWALMHGTIIIVFPAYILLAFLLLRPIARRLQVQDASADTTKQKSISLLAILSVLSSTTGFLIPVVGSFIGIAFGHIARRRCKIHPDIYGSGIALAGLILGYVSLAYSTYVIGIVSWVASKNGS